MFLQLGRQRGKAHRMIRPSGSTSSTSGIESSSSSLRLITSPPPSYMPDSVFNLRQDTTAESQIANLQQENERLQEEVARLHQQLEWSFNLLTEMQRNLLSTQSQLKAVYHRKQFDREPAKTRRVSSQVTPSSENRIRKVSRSLDSIQHELIRLQLEQTITEISEPATPQLPAMLNHKSPKLRAKTTRSHK